MKQISLISLILLLASCNELTFETEPANNPIENFESVWSTFNEKYAAFQVRKVNWDSLYAVYRPLVTVNSTDDDLFEVITDLLSHLDDGHVSLMAANRPFWSGHEVFRELEGNDLFDLATVRSEYLNSGIQIVSNQYLLGQIGDDIGYLYIASVAGDEPTFIDQFIEEHRDKDGIIIDLRHNNGGDFTNSEFIASRFASARRLAFEAQPKAGPSPDEFGDIYQYFIGPEGSSQFTRPTIVITNGYTISAGENLVLYMRTMDHVTVLGDTTAGAMGERIEKEMPNGWIYSITAQVITAADENIYEGPGIPPDIQIRNSRDSLDIGVDNMLDQAINLIRNQ